MLKRTVSSREARRLARDTPPGYQVYLWETFSAATPESVIAALSDPPQPQPEQTSVWVRRPRLTAPRRILSRPEIVGPARFRIQDSESDDEIKNLGRLRVDTFPMRPDGSRPHGEFLFTQALLARRMFLRLRVEEFCRLEFWVWYYLVQRIQ